MSFARKYICASVSLPFAVSHVTLREGASDEGVLVCPAVLLLELLLFETGRGDE